MIDQYLLTQVEYNKLLLQVSIADMIKNLWKFHAEENPVCLVKVLLFLDDWHGKKGKHTFIYDAVFNSMNTQDKMTVLEYIDWLENGDEDNGY